MLARPGMLLHVLSTSLILMLGQAAPSSEAEGRPTLIVLNFTGGGGIDKGIVQSFTEAVTTEVARRGFFHTVSAQEVQTMIGYERQKELMGCAENSTNCLTELAGAMGAQFVLSGSVTKFGDLVQLNLQTLDSQKAQPIGRSTRLSPTLEGLRGQVPMAVAEATGTPLPTPTGRVAGYALVGVGAAAVVTGAAFGFTALNNEAAVNRELQLAQTSGVYRSAPDYAADASSIGRDKTLALIGLAAGAVLIGSGSFFIVHSNASGLEVALVPTTSGAAFAGVFP